MFFLLLPSFVVALKLSFEMILETKARFISTVKRIFSQTETRNLFQMWKSGSWSSFVSICVFCGKGWFVQIRLVWPFTKSNLVCCLNLHSYTNITLVSNDYFKSHVFDITLFVCSESMLFFSCIWHTLEIIHGQIFKFGIFTLQLSFSKMLLNLYFKSIS